VSPPDRFEILASRFGGADPVSGGGVALKPLEVEGPNASGVVRVSFRMSRGGKPCGSARATVRGVVRGPALLASRTLPRGEEIPLDAVRVAEADLTRLRQEPLRDPEGIVGKVPVRSLGKDRIVTAELLAPAPVVRRGETVDLWIETDRMSVRASARVRLDAAPGDVVVAENPSTGAEILAEVQPDGSLRVVRRSERAR
jgi:flagella basal body P-ring formation protein FlgA